MKTAIIKIGEENGSTTEMDCQLNGVPKVQVIEALNVLLKQLARDVVADAEKHVGKNPDAQAKWIDRQRGRPDLN